MCVYAYINVHTGREMHPHMYYVHMPFSEMQKENKSRRPRILD